MREGKFDNLVIGICEAVKSIVDNPKLISEMQVESKNNIAAAKKLTQATQENYAIKTSADEAVEKANKAADKALSEQAKATDILAEVKQKRALLATEKSDVAKDKADLADATKINQDLLDDIKSESAKLKKRNTLFETQKAEFETVKTEQQAKLKAALASI